MDYKTVFLMLCLVGMGSAYNASIESNLSDANNLILNETLGSINSLQTNSSGIIQFLIVLGFIIVITLLLYFIIPVVWGWLF